MRLFFVTLLSIAIFSTTAFSQQNAWSGGGGTNNQRWSSGSNWQLGRPPSQNDTAVFDVDAFVDLTGSANIANGIVVGQDERVSVNFFTGSILNSFGNSTIQNGSTLVVDNGVRFWQRDPGSPTMLRIGGGSNGVSRLDIRNAARVDTDLLSLGNSSTLDLLTINSGGTLFVRNLADIGTSTRGRFDVSDGNVSGGHYSIGSQNGTSTLNVSGNSSFDVDTLSVGGATTKRLGSASFQGSGTASVNFVNVGVGFSSSATVTVANGFQFDSQQVIVGSSDQNGPRTGSFFVGTNSTLSSNQIQVRAQGFVSSSGLIDVSELDNDGRLTINENGHIVVGQSYTGFGNVDGNGVLQIDGLLDAGDSIAAFDQTASLEMHVDLIMGNNSQTHFDFGGGTEIGEFDQITGIQNASLNGNLSIDLLTNFGFAPNQQFLLMEINGTLDGQFNNFGEGDLVGIWNGVNVFLTYEGGTGNDVMLFTSITEPSCFAVLVLIPIALRIRRRSSTQN